MHQFSCRAAYAAFCASLQDKFWEYSHLLYTQQENLPDSQLYAFAKELHLDTGRFDACMNDELPKDEVRKDLAEGQKLKIRGTPTVFINGKQYTGPPTLEGFRQAIATP
jgi:protein-disulfide isomerase